MNNDYDYKGTIQHVTWNLYFEPSTLLLTELTAHVMTSCSVYTACALSLPNLLCAFDQTNLNLEKILSMDPELPGQLCILEMKAQNSMGNFFSLLNFWFLILTSFHQLLGVLFFITSSVKDLSGKFSLSSNLNFIRVG